MPRHPSRSQTSENPIADVGFEVGRRMNGIESIPPKSALRDSPKNTSAGISQVLREGRNCFTLCPDFLQRSDSRKKVPFDLLYSSN